MLPLRVGILVTLVASAAYEPLRWLTTMLSPSLDEALGGVGGVGGLANLGSPTANCSTTTGGARAPYCFYPGLVFGLTPFALVVLAVWVLPLALGALAATARKCAATLTPTASTATASRSLCGAWVLMNVAWFALPLAQYVFFDPFLERSLWSRVLAASIAAAYPLSWNLSLVAIPSAGANYLPALLAVSRAQLISTHKVAACSSLFWALLHAGGQIAYLVSAGKLRAQLSPSKGEHLLYCFGALTLALLLALATLAAFRRHRGIAPWFRAAHRAMATLALLSAAAHWWPFALLLCPAVAVGATGAAVLARAKVEGEREGELQDGQLAGGPRGSAAALAASLGASVAGLCAVWAVRGSVMGRAEADTYSPFAFPPLALVLGGLAARAAAGLVLARWCNRSKHAASLLPPSLPPPPAGDIAPLPFSLRSQQLRSCHLGVGPLGST